MTATRDLPCFATGEPRRTSPIDEAAATVASAACRPTDLARNGLIDRDHIAAGRGGDRA